MPHSPRMRERGARRRCSPVHSHFGRVCPRSKARAQVDGPRLSISRVSCRRSRRNGSGRVDGCLARSHSPSPTADALFGQCVVVDHVFRPAQINTLWQALLFCEYLVQYPRQLHPGLIEPLLRDWLAGLLVGVPKPGSRPDPLAGRLVVVGLPGRQQVKSTIDEVTYPVIAGINCDLYHCHLRVRGKPLQNACIFDWGRQKWLHRLLGTGANLKSRRLIQTRTLRTCV